jgi:hypothetical protein
MNNRKQGVKTEIIEVRLKQYWNNQRNCYRDCFELDCGHAEFQDHDPSNASSVGGEYTCHGEHGAPDKPRR